jgi:hypothetical protein
MPKYVPKFKRERCAHIYKKTMPEGPKKGEQCPKTGRLDRDGKYRCCKHTYKKYIFKNKDRIKRELIAEMKQLAVKLETLRKTEEEYGFSTPIPSPLKT